MIPGRRPPPPDARPGAWGRRLLTLAITVGVTGLLFAADVVTKDWAEHELRPRGARQYLGGHLVLRYQTNSGIAFGLLQRELHPRKRDWLIAYGSVVTAGLAAVLIWRVLSPAGRGPGTPGRRSAVVGLAAMLAGAAGNLRDRVQRGAVVDFLDVSLWSGWRWPAFNLADLFLAVGLVLCAHALVKTRRLAD